MNMDQPSEDKTIIETELKQGWPPTYYRGLSVGFETKKGKYGISYEEPGPGGDSDRVFMPITDKDEITFKNNQTKIDATLKQKQEENQADYERYYQTNDGGRKRKSKYKNKTTRMKHKRSNTKKYRSRSRRQFFNPIKTNNKPKNKTITQ